MINRINNMEQRLKKAFKNISEVNPRPNLERIILRKIELAKKRQLRYKLILTYAGLIGSVAAAIYAGLTYGGSFLQSDFWNLVSLAFSDISTVAQHWQAFLMSLLETFPVMSAIAILVPIVILLLSLGMYLDLNSKQYHKHI